MKKNINDSSEQSISTTELGNLAENLGELAIDSVLKDGVLKDIPLIGTLISLTKLGTGIRDWKFTKKVFTFLNELKEVPREKKIEFAETLKNNKDQEKKVGETILSIIDRIDDLEKAVLIGKLYAETIVGNIVYPDFLKLSNIINKAYFPDLAILKRIKKKDNVKDLEYESLVTLGLISMKLEDETDRGGNRGFSTSVQRGFATSTRIKESMNQKINYQINEYGELLLKYVL